MRAIELFVSPPTSGNAVCTSLSALWTTYRELQPASKDSQLQTTCYPEEMLTLASELSGRLPETMLSSRTSKPINKILQCVAKQRGNISRNLKKKNPQLREIIRCARTVPAACVSELVQLLTYLLHGAESFLRS